uniref:RNase H domain-containing protein n=1 Tax=Strongyloides venezuelensis TaxID=75913 RepID=A0A0K0FPN2_STRVS
MDFHQQPFQQQPFQQQPFQQSPFIFGQFGNAQTSGIKTNAYFKDNTQPSPLCFSGIFSNPNNFRNPLLISPVGNDISIDKKSLEFILFEKEEQPQDKNLFAHLSSENCSITRDSFILDPSNNGFDILCSSIEATFGSQSGHNGVAYVIILGNMLLTCYQRTARNISEENNELKAFSECFEKITSIYSKKRVHYLINSAPVLELIRSHKDNNEHVLNKYKTEPTRSYVINHMKSELLLENVQYSVQKSKYIMEILNKLGQSAFLSTPVNIPFTEICRFSEYDEFFS